MEITEIIEKLRTEVLAKQTVLAEVYRRNSKKSLLEYSQSWQTNNSARIGIFSKYLSRHLEAIYGSNVAKEAIDQFNQESLASTIDHHGLLSHPFFINSNLIYSLRKPKYLICFPTSGISLNNNTSWSACLLLHNKQGSMKRLSFFPDTYKTQAVFSTQAIGRKDVTRLLVQISSLEIDTMAAGNLEQFVRHIFDKDQFYQIPSFSQQAAYASRELWKCTFPSGPELVYAPLEELVSDILVNEIAKDTENVLNKLLFSESGWDLIEKHFQGSLGAFTNNHKGSFLFWGVNGKKRRVHLMRGKGNLSGDGMYLGSGPETLCQYLGDGSIYPTSLTCFLVLLHYGVTCLGGFNQVNWLTNIKNTYLDLIGAMGETGEMEIVKKVVTHNFAEGNLAFGLVDGRLFKPTGVDILLSGKDWLHNYHRLPIRSAWRKAWIVNCPRYIKLLLQPRTGTPSMQLLPKLIFWIV
jgi:hypothetical protein